MNEILPLLFLSLLVSANAGTKQVNNLQIWKCSKDTVEDLSLSDLSITIEQNNHDSEFIVSGIFHNTITLESPVWASSNLKRKVLFSWIKVPCIDNMGSCYYKDLCQYGIPGGKPCPPIFKKLNIPCRCPIAPGVYKVPLATISGPRIKFPINGYYKGGVTIGMKNNNLACYNFKFRIQDKFERIKLFSNRRILAHYYINNQAIND